MARRPTPPWPSAPHATDAPSVPERRRSDLKQLMPPMVDKFHLGVLRPPPEARSRGVPAAVPFYTELRRQPGQGLGMSLEFGPSGEVIVMAVEGGSPADEANLQKGDRIVDVGGVAASAQTIGSLFPQRDNTFELGVVRTADDGAGSRFASPTSAAGAKGLVSRFEAVDSAVAAIEALDTQPAPDPFDGVEGARIEVRITRKLGEEVGLELRPVMVT